MGIGMRIMGWGDGDGIDRDNWFGDGDKIVGIIGNRDKRERDRDRDNRDRERNRAIENTTSLESENIHYARHKVKSYTQPATL